MAVSEFAILHLPKMLWHTKGAHHRSIELAVYCLYVTHTPILQIAARKMNMKDCLAAWGSPEGW